MEVKTPCKCCGGKSPVFGICDWYKNAHDPEYAFFGLSGKAVYYRRCPACGFIFTNDFDQWTPQEWGEFVYNEDYGVVDGDYKEARPKRLSVYLADQLRDYKSAAILDYGGGSGRLAAHLRAAGFSDIETYDPFVAEFSPRPERTFDIITCYEVLEHSPKPQETLADILSLLKFGGVAEVSTLYQPEDIESQGIDWWYIAPRNGHVSLFTPQALRAVVEPLGAKVYDQCTSIHRIEKLS